MLFFGACIWPTDSSWKCLWIRDFTEIRLVRPQLNSYSIPNPFTENGLNSPAFGWNILSCSRAIFSTFRWMSKNHNFPSEQNASSDFWFMENLHFLARLHDCFSSFSNCNWLMVCWICHNILFRHFFNWKITQTIQNVTSSIFWIFACSAKHK